MSIGPQLNLLNAFWKYGSDSATSAQSQVDASAARGLEKAKNRMKIHCVLKIPPRRHQQHIRRNLARGFGFFAVKPRARLALQRVFLREPRRQRVVDAERRHEHRKVPLKVQK